MYESKYKPQLLGLSLSLDGARFGIRHSARFYKPDDESADPPHIHEYHEIYFNIDSNVSFFADGALYPVHRGEAFVSRAGEVHVCIYNKEQKHDHICLWLDLPKGSMLTDFLYADDFCPRLSFDRAERENLFEKLFALLEYFDKNCIGLEGYSCLLDILVILSRAMGRSSGSEALPEHFKAILDDLEENFAEIRSVAELVERNFVSPATLNRLFRKYANTSPREYLEAKKLAHAAKMLAGGAGVTETCISSGFSDASHFIALFKKKFGETPLQYKKGHI